MYIFTYNFQSQTLENFECVMYVVRFWHPSFDDRLGPTEMSSDTKASVRIKEYFPMKIFIIHNLESLVPVLILPLSLHHHHGRYKPIQYHSLR